MGKSKKKKLSQLSGKIWANGTLIDWGKANVHVLTHGLNYGTGVFEGIRAYNTSRGPAIFRLDDHIKRFLSSANSIGLKPPFSYTQLCEAQYQVVKANKLKNAYLRPIMFLDDGGLGLAFSTHEVKVMVAAMEWGTYLGQEALEKGITVGISSFRRHSPNISMCRSKVTGNYINSVLASQEAERHGYQEALLLDADGYVSEGAGENLFAVNNGVLYTPTLDSCLGGITRASVIELAIDLGIQVREQRMTRDEIYNSDELFFTGTAAEVTPIRQVDGHKIGSGKRGRVTTKLQKEYFDCVYGRNPDHEDWNFLVADFAGSQKRSTQK